MIKRIVAALSLLMVSGLAHAVIINFDELASGTVVNNVYDGVTFGTAAGDGEVRVYSSCCSESDPNSIAPHPGGGFDFNGQMSVMFDFAVNNLMFFIGGDNDAGAVGLVDIFDAGGLIATINLIADGDGAGSTEELQDLSAYANVTGINIYNVTDAAGLVYDTFSYDIADVPEPGTLALLGLGLFAMGLSRRKKI